MDYLLVRKYALKFMLVRILMKKSLQSENVNSSSNLITTIAGKSLPMHWLSTNFGKLEAIHRPMGSHCPARGAAVKSKD